MPKKYRFELLRVIALRKEEMKVVPSIMRTKKGRLRGFILEAKNLKGLLFCKTFLHARLYKKARVAISKEKAVFINHGCPFGSASVELKLRKNDWREFYNEGEGCAYRIQLMRHGLKIITHKPSPDYHEIA